MLFALAGYALVGGAISFSGWPLDVPGATDWLNTGVSIQPNAALLMALSGAAIILLHFRRTSLALILGAFVALAGLLILLQYIVGADFGFNHQLLFGREWGQGTTMTRGRVGPPASSSFTLIGASLVILALSQRRGPAAVNMRGLVPILGIAVCTFMLFSLIGYLFGARQFYTVPWLTAIALQTATMLMALAVALIVAVPERQPMLLLRQDTMAAMLARWVVPVLIALPVVVMWLRAEGETHGLYDEGTGRALAAVVLVTGAVALMWIALVALERGEERLRDTQRRLRAILEQLPVAVGVTDRDGAWTLTNPIMDGYVPRAIPSTISDQMPRWRAWDADGNLVPAESWPGRRALRGEVVAAGLEMLFRTDEGPDNWMRVSAAPLRDEPGAILGAIVVVQNIHAAKQAEIALQKINNELERIVEERTNALVKVQRKMQERYRMAAVGTMAAGLAHDMNNLTLPLSVRLEHLLASPALSEDARKELSIVTALVDHLRELGRNLSLFARDPEKEGSGGRTHLGRWCSATHNLLNASINPHATIDEARPICINWDCPDDLPEVAIAPHRLTQVVQNLIHNARDAIIAKRLQNPAAYFESGLIAVTARCDRAIDAVRLDICDSGIGMDEATRRRSIDPFFTTKERPSPQHSVVGGGTGLGMSLAYQIMQRIGGEMHIESAPGAGTTVTLLLPLAASGAHTVNAESGSDASKGVAADAAGTTG